MGATPGKTPGYPLEKRKVHEDGGAALDVTGDSTIAQSANLSFRHRMALVADHARRLDHSALDDSDSHDRAGWSDSVSAARMAGRAGRGDDLMVGRNRHNR